MPLAAETCVATHAGDRSEQQDRVAVFRHPSRAGLLLAVVADGMGGHLGGGMAAEQVVLRARQNFEVFMPRHESAEELLGGIIDEAHRMMRLTRFTTCQDPHSTAALLLLQPGRANWAHCGDSRLYHLRGKRILFRSEDHSLVGELRRKGRIDDEVALVHPRRNVLLSCLGSGRGLGGGRALLLSTWSRRVLGQNGRRAQDERQSSSDTTDAQRARKSHVFILFSRKVVVSIAPGDAAERVRCDLR